MDGWVSWQKKILFNFYEMRRTQMFSFLVVKYCVYLIWNLFPFSVYIIFEIAAFVAYTCMSSKPKKRNQRSHFNQPISATTQYHRAGFVQMDVKDSNSTTVWIDAAGRVNKNILQQNKWNWSNHFCLRLNESSVLQHRLNISHPFIVILIWVILVYWKWTRIPSPIICNVQSQTVSGVSLPSFYKKKICGTILKVRKKFWITLFSL